MITFDDIKDVFNKTNDDTLSTIYTERQMKSIQLNEEAAREILIEFPCETMSVPSYLSDIEKVNYLMSMYLNSGNPKVIKTVWEVLLKHHYQVNSELLKTMQRTDFYFNDDINLITYSNLVYGAISIKNINDITQNNVNFNTSYGDLKLFPLDRTYGMGKIDATKRRGFCHNLTSDILSVNKDLYGAYYYIPIEFAGFMEHSVLLDLKHHLVLDFANNIVMSLDIWQKYYNKPTILIKGDEFSELSKRCNDELGIYLTTCTLDNVRRIRKR